MLNLMSFKSFQGFTYNSDTSLKQPLSFLTAQTSTTQVYYRLEGFKDGNSKQDLTIVKNK